MSVPAPQTPAGREGWRALLQAPARALLALDYDGTLAPVRDRPQDAVPARGAVPLLTRLAAAVGAVALVTGREAAGVVALGGLADVPGLVVLGQYGLQRWSAGRLDSPAEVPGLAGARAGVADLLAGTPARLEDKGLSLVVHARAAPDPVALLTGLEPRLRAIAAQAGLELHHGRLVLELRPAGTDKGGALRSLSAGRSAVLYAGDDLGDLPAYDAVGALRAEGLPGITVCSDSAETPAQLRERADLVVAGPAGVVAMLAELADAVGA